MHVYAYGDLLTKKQDIKIMQNIDNKQDTSKHLLDKLSVGAVSNRFSSMTRDEAIQYCYQHKDDYIRDFDSVSEGVRQFDCLIAILEYGTIKPTDLPQYGMDY